MKKRKGRAFICDIVGLAILYIIGFMLSYTVAFEKKHIVKSDIASKSQVRNFAMDKNILGVNNRMKAKEENEEEEEEGQKEEEEEENEEEPKDRGGAPPHFRRQWLC